MEQKLLFCIPEKQLDMESLVIPNSVLVVPDIDVSTIPVYRIELALNHYRIMRESVSARSSLMMEVVEAMATAGVYFSHERCTQLSQEEKPIHQREFTLQEKLVMNQVIKKLFNYDMPTVEELVEQEVTYYSQRFPQPVAERYANIVSVPLEEWTEAEWSLHTEVSRLRQREQPVKTVALRNESGELLTDTEYGALLTGGYDAVKNENFFDINDIKRKLSQYVTELVQTDGREVAATNFTADLHDTALRLAEEVRLIPSDRVVDLWITRMSMTEEEFSSVNNWVETQFGSKLVQFSDLIRQGINPITLEELPL